MIMNIQEILDCLPHRYPFILVDRVIECEKGKRLVAIKNVTINEPFFMGHFPGQPVMPGVLMLEALAQASTLLAYLSSDSQSENGSYYLFAGVENCRFKRMVLPGDQLHLEIDFLWEKRGVSKVSASALVDGDLACSAELMSAKRAL